MVDLQVFRIYFFILNDFCSVAFSLILIQFESCLYTLNIFMEELLSTLYLGTATIKCKHKSKINMTSHVYTSKVNTISMQQDATE